MDDVLSLLQRQARKESGGESTIEREADIMSIEGIHRCRNRYIPLVFVLCAE